MYLQATEGKIMDKLTDTQPRKAMWACYIVAALVAAATVICFG